MPRQILIALLAVFAIPLLAAGKKSPPTFADDIAPIIHSNCTSCHRPGEAAPFPLLAYDDVRKRARTIQRVIETRYMPPWHPVSGHGDFLGERRLTDAEISAFTNWIEAGKPQGDPARTPAPPEFPEGWQLGEPDLVVRMNGSFDVPADGRDVYRNFVVPLDLDEDKWVKAIELRPTARPVVHHVLFFLDSSGTAREKDGADGAAGFKGMGFQISGRLGGYVPGPANPPLPLDLAYALPKGSDLVLQTHFHPVGKAMTESFTVGLHFADKPPSRKLVNIQVPPGFGRGMKIDIPAGENNYRVTDSFTLPSDAEAVGISGHAHYVCQEMKMTAALPDGTTKSLLFIDDWDLNWQDRYTFKEPVSLPAGTVLTTELVYDNSADNPDNPFTPPQRIKWGQASTDEMGSITLMVVPADASTGRLLGAASRIDQGRAAPLAHKALLAVLDNLPAIVRKADKNADGQLDASEVPPRMRAQLHRNWDVDKNEVLDRQELEAMYKTLKKIRDAQRANEKPKA